MAPETWESNEYTKSVDVYSFSIIVYEIMTGEEAFQNFTFQMFYSKVAMNGYRPEFKCPIPSCYKNLICQCWSSDPEKRPTFSEIVEELKSNDKFITSTVDEDKYYDYIDLLENSKISFDPSKKFQRVDISSISTEQSDIVNLNEFINLPSETKQILKQLMSINNSKFITIPSDNVAILLKNKSFISDNFHKILSQFNQVIIEVTYPSKIFKSSIQSIKHVIENTNCTQLLIILKEVNIHTFDDFPKIGFPPFSIQFDDSIKSIPVYAFSECTLLREVTIPSSVTRISGCAFKDCSSLTKATIPSSITKIKGYAFCDCTSLIQITIPSSIKKIKECTFCGCSSLKQITIPSSVTIIQDSSFSSCSSLEKISFEYPSSLTGIGDSAFYECSSLKQITIPSSVNKIGEASFSRCKSLEQISFESPSSLTEVGDSAFKFSDKIKEISFPPSLTDIGDYAFFRCASLKKITVPSDAYVSNHGIGSQVEIVEY